MIPNSTIDALLDFLQNLDFDSTDLYRSIDLASIVGSEHPVQSFCILKEIYGYYLFAENTFPEDLSQFFASNFATTDEWQNENIKYSMLYLCGYIFAQSVANIVRRIEKPEPTDLIYMAKAIFTMHFEEVEGYPPNMLKVIQLLEIPWCRAAAQISLSLDPACTFDIMINETNNLNLQSKILPRFYAIYYSQVRVFGEKSRIDSKFQDFVLLLDKLITIYTQEPENRELLSLLLYNIFGQMFAYIPESRPLPIIQNLYENLMLLLQRETNIKNTLRLVVLLAVFNNKPIDFIFTANIPPNYKLKAMTVAIRGKHYATDVEYEEAIKNWEYQSDSDENCHKCIEHINSLLKDYIVCEKDFHAFLMEVSHISISDFKQILSNLQAKKSMCPELFFNEMSYFLYHNEYQDLQLIAKKIAVQDNIDRYIKEFNLTNAGCTVAYKYETMMNFYHRAIESDMDQAELYKIFYSFDSSMCNSSIYLPDDLSIDLLDWKKYLSDAHKNIYQNSEEKIVQAEVYDGNQKTIYSLINYITFAYQSGVNEMPALKSIVNLLIHPNIDIGNKALWALQYSILKNPHSAPEIIGIFLKIALTNYSLCQAKLTLVLSALCILIPCLITPLSFQSITDIEKFIFYGLCQPSYTCRSKALELIGILHESSNFAKFFIENQEKISKLGINQAKTMMQVGLSKTLPEIEIPFEKVANSNNNILYFFYFSAFTRILHQKDPVAEAQCLEFISTAPENMVSIGNPYFYCIVLCFRAICGSLTDTMMNEAYGVITPSQEIYFTLAISNVQMKDQDAVFKNIANHRPRGQTAGAALAFMLSLEDQFLESQIEKLTTGFKFFHDSLIISYIERLIIPDQPTHTLKTDHFKTNDNLLSFLSITTFLTALGNIFRRIKETHNTPPKGIFGLCLSPPPKFYHEVSNLTEYAFMYNLTACELQPIKRCAEYALTQWIFFGQIDDIEAKKLLTDFESVEFSTNILASHFNCLLRRFVDESINLSARLFAICNQFDLSMRTDDKQYFEIINLMFGKLLALGFTAISFGDDGQREKGFNLLICIASGIYFQNHTTEETEKFMQELEEHKSGICGSYADIDLSVHLFSVCLSKYFLWASEMFISAVFHLESEFVPKKKINTGSRSCSIYGFKLEKYQDKSQNYGILKLLNILRPWLKFNDLRARTTLIQDCPQRLSCYTPYSFLKSLLSLKCAKPLSSSVAAVIASMANSSTENAMTTFANLLYIVNKDKEIYTQTLSALTLVLTVASSFLSNQILSVTKVQSWFALNSSYIKKSFKFKKTLRASIEILTQLIKDGGDDILAYKHIILAFALITGPIFRDESEQLMSAITHQAVNNTYKHVYVTSPQTHPDQLTRGIVSGHRPEQIADWFRNYTHSQMYEVKNMLLQWALCCLDLSVSASAFSLLNVLNANLNNHESELVAVSLVRFAQSLHQFTTKAIESNDLNYLISNTNGVLLEKLYGTVIISSGLMLLKGNLNMMQLEISSNFLVCTDDDLTPIYSASLLTVSEAFENENLLTQMDFSNILLIILININSNKALNIIRRVLCVCFVKKPSWCMMLYPFIQFCLAPLVWNTGGDRARYQSVLDNAADTSLKNLIDASIDIRTYYWHAVTELTQKNICDAASYFGKVTKYGEPSEAVASYLLLSAMLDKSHVNEKTPGIQIALNQAVSTTDEFLVDAATVFLKSAVKAEVTTVTQIGPSKKQKPFPIVSTTVDIGANYWRYDQKTSFKNIDTLPPLIVLEDDETEIIPENADIEPFSTWYKSINIVEDLQSVLNVTDYSKALD